MLAVQHLLEGKGITEVARMVRASPSSVKRWKDTLEKEGLDALKAKPHPGPKPRLNLKQKQRLLALLLRGPLAAGYATEVWTCPRVAEVIDRYFGVRYHPSTVWDILRSLGWTCQKPEQRARETNDREIARWRREEWPRILKKGRSQS